MSQSLKVNKEFGSVSATGSVIDYIVGTGALGAVSVAQDLTVVKSTGASSGTLPAGKEGQIKRFITTVATGTFTLTPAGGLNAANTTIAFTAVGGSATLVYVGSKWWVLASSASGITIA